MIASVSCDVRAVSPDARVLWMSALQNAVL